MEIKENDTSLNSEGAARAKAIARRRVAYALIERILPWLRAAMFLAGIMWMMCIPMSNLGRGTYIDENALQPGQVNTYWNWREVHAADGYLEDLERLRDTNATSQQRASYFREQFEKLGLPAAVQPYTIRAPTGDTHGVNAYSIYSAPRTSGNEAIVLSASWKSLKWEEDGSLNLRGIATVLALAGYIKRYTLWAKDIVFVVSDGYMDGMHAWLSAYHGFEHSNVQTQPLSLLSGVIWTALCIDYPGHSFSHLGVYFEGLNGRLPNQDLINSALHIARHSNGVNVLVYDVLDHLRTDHPHDFGPRMRTLWSHLPQPIQKYLNDASVKLFENRADLVRRGISWQASGRASGVHGLFHQYRIDAISLYARPSHGPHGFYALGKIIESTTRTMNNLLERLHASFFFYLLSGAHSFVKIGGYLPAAVVMSVAMTFGGLALWVQAGWTQKDATDRKSNNDVAEKSTESTKLWVRRTRPVVDAFVLAGCTHGLGVAGLFAMGTKASVQAFTAQPTGYLIVLLLVTVLVPAFVASVPRLSPVSPGRAAPLSILLKSFTLCLGGAITALLSLLNFSLAAATVVLLGIPLSYLPPTKSSLGRCLGVYGILSLLTPPFAALVVGYVKGQGELVQLGRTIIWEWKVLGVWTFPYTMIKSTNGVRESPRAQLRRPVHKGLAQGEHLSRLPIPTASTFSEWGWVGTEVHSAEDIGPHHRAATCGFRKHICKNKYAPRKDPTPPSESTSDDDVVVISSDDEQECSTKACKSNPNCCNYLGQQSWENEGQARKKYLVAAGLGPDPEEYSRTSDLPVGLKNLGATCYANAFIQVWFQDLAFRAGVYNCIPELSLVPGKSVEESPVYQLQITFGALQNSREKSFNPVKFVECLGIRTAEQQDAQEQVQPFSKLFMSHLDNEFKKQDSALLQSLMTDQFEGRQVYGTRCGTCQNASEHQSSFLELEISLTTDCKLEDRLKASLEDEKLDGDNQYDCSTCGSKQDAFRYLKLTHLPPVLHFSVLRFVFDPEQLRRKKSKHTIAFPLSINMRPFVDGDNTPLWYDLHGVLLHRGPSAYHGHYEAQVFDVMRNRWFLFNDEEVREIKMDELVGKQTAGDSRLQSSKDAYMLIYAQRDAPSVDAATLKIPKHASDAVERLNADHQASHDSYIHRKKQFESDFASIRKSKQQIYKSWHISGIEECSIVLDKVALESWIVRELDKETYPRTTRSPDNTALQSADGVLSTPHQPEGSASPPPPNAIMREFNSPKKCNESQAIPSQASRTESQITCKHGLLDPTKAANMKRISKKAWDSIQELGTDMVAIESNSVCEDCIAALFNEKLYVLQHADLISRFESCMNKDKEGGWWISKSWLKDWKLKRPKMHIPGHRDPMPDSLEFRSDVYCEHDGLAHPQRLREKITTAALKVLKEVFPEFNPPNIETETCSVCEAVAANDREATREIRSKAEAEKTRLSTLARRDLTGAVGVSRLVEGLTRVLIPQSFLQQWRAWIGKPTLTPRPGPIDNDEFICQHGQLLIDPIEETDMDGIICAITPKEWEVLKELYGGGPYIECTLLEEEDGSSKGIVQSNMLVCHDCRKARLSDYGRAEIEVYRLADGEVIPGLPNSTAAKSTSPPASTKSTGPSDIIHIDDTDESPTLSDPASPPARAPGSRKRPKCSTAVTTYSGQRKSKRLRTATNVKKGTTFNIRVSKDDTLRDVKRKIQDAEDILSFYQQLYFHGVELTDDSQTLSQIGFLRTDRLVLRAIEAMDEDEAVNWALTSGDAEPKTVRPQPEGRAFGGTLLDGTLYAAPNASVPSKTSENGDHEMTPTNSTPPSRNANARSVVEPLKELDMDHIDASFHVLDDEAGSSTTSNACPSCTFINAPGVVECEICERPLRG